MAKFGNSPHHQSAWRSGYVLGASLDRATYLSHSVFGEIYGAVRADHAVRGVHDIPWPSSRRLQRCGAPDGYHQLHWQPSHDAPQLGVAASRDRVMGIPDCAGIVRVRSAATPCEICMEADTTTGACMVPARSCPRARGYSILDDLVCRGFTRVPVGAIRQNLIGTLSRRSNRRHLRSEEHTSELQSLRHLVCRLLLEKKKHKTMHS